MMLYFSENFNEKPPYIYDLMIRLDETFVHASAT